MSEKELRELDAWIAEHVMGCKPWDEEKVRCILQPNEFVLSIPSKIVRARIGAGQTADFEPTSNHASAMMVLEKCFERVGLIDMSRVKVEPFNFCVGATYKTGCESEASTLPLAICLFAKKLFTK